MAGKKFKAKLGDVQKQLDPRGLCSKRLRADSSSSQDSAWIDLASAVLPGVYQTVAGVMAEAIRSGTYSEGDLLPVVSRHGLQWSVPPEFLQNIATFVAACCQQIHKSPGSIEYFLRQYGFRGRPTAYYQVFHHGRLQTNCDRLPEDVLDLKDHILFWIDHTTGEMQSCGVPAAKEARLQPKAEEMLQYLCRIEHAGQTIPLTDVAESLWGASSPSTIGSIQNNIGIHQNAIKRFAERKFIVGSGSRAQLDERMIVRLRGQDAYRIGRQAHEELCVVRKIDCS